MPQWTAFDEETSSALRAKLPEDAVTELTSTSALDYALNGKQSLVAVLPCRGFGQAGLAVFRWNSVPAVPPPPAPAPAFPGKTRTGGFLGLTDEPAFEEENEKKSWWKKFWGI